MKIAYIYTNFHLAGGIERITSAKLNYLADIEKNDVHLILSDDGSQEPYYKLSDNIKLHYLSIDFPKNKSLKQFYKWYFKEKQAEKLYEKRLEELLLKEKFDIVVCVFFNAASKFLYKINDGSKKILETHQDKYGALREAENSKFPLLTHWSLSNKIKNFDNLTKHYDAFVVLTEGDKSKWKYQNNIHAIPNFTDFVEKHKSVYADYHQKKVICAGRISHHQHKGWDLLIKAWYIVVKDFPDWHLDLVGTSNKEPYDLWIQEVKALNLSKSISFHPMTNEIEKWYKNHSIFVMASRYEGFGIVLIEAMSCGLPLVAFDCPSGPAEIITNTEDGYLAEAENIQDLADKLMLLMKQEEKRREMGYKAKENVMRFSVENVMNQWESLFKQLLRI